MRPWSRRIAVALAVIAVTGMTAAAAAQAAVFKTEGEIYPADITVYQKTELTMTVAVEAGKNPEVKCGSAIFDGVATENDEVLWVHPEYAECSAFGLPATITPTGCDYQFRVNETLDVVCTAGNSIKVKTATCEFRIGAQKGLKNVTLTNETIGARKVVMLGLGISEFAYTNTVDGFACPLPDKLGHKDGTYVGEVSAQAEVGGAELNFTVE